MTTESTATPKQLTIPELEAKRQDLLIKSQEAAKAGDVDTLTKLANEAKAINKQIAAIQKGETDKLLEANKTLIDSLIEALRQDTMSFVKSRQTAYDKLVALGLKVETIRFESETAAGGVTTFYVGEKKAKKAATASGDKEKSTVSGSKSANQVRLADGTVMSTRDFVEKYATDEERNSGTWLGAKDGKGWPTALAPKIAKRIGATIEKKVA